MDVTITDLWIAIVASGVLCWIASALIHMLIKYHNHDYSELGNEDEVAKALAASNAKPALYPLPFCIDPKQMEDPAIKQKFESGPVAMIAVMPNGMPPMGKLLGLQLAFFVLGSCLIAYLATLGMGLAATDMQIFRFVFVAAFLAYGWAEIPFSIWMGHPWSNCFRFLIDAFIYAIVSATTFMFFWPSVA